MIDNMAYNKTTILGKNSSSVIEILKWLGILAMTFDHAGILIFKHIEILRMFGRLAFPIFGFVLIYNFMYHTKNKARYIKRIAFFSLLFEPIHFLVFQDHYAGLNIFFIYTLALSFSFLFELVQNDKKIDKNKGLFLVIFLVLSIYVSQYTEFRISGFLVTISFYFSLKDKKFILITLFLLILLNAPDIKYIFPTLIVIPVGYLISKITIKIPRSRYLFYSYYPIHILVLGAYAYHW